MAESKSNFSFLKGQDALLLRLGEEAERAFAHDPGTTIVKMRQLGEAIAQHSAAACGAYVGPNMKQLDLLRLLESKGMLGREVANIFHTIRRAGNAAVHEFLSDHRVALNVLTLGRQLAAWFVKTFGGNPDLVIGKFHKPRDPSEFHRIQEEKVAALRAQLAESSESEALKAELLEAERLAREEAEKAKKGLEDERDAAFQLAVEQEQNALRTAAAAAKAAAAAAASKHEREAAERAMKKAQQKLVAERDELVKGWEAREAELKARFETTLSEIQKAAEQKPSQELRDLAKTAQTTSAKVELTEAETRFIIDAQLRAVGWDADSEALKHSAGTRPQKGKNIAIAEWPTKSGPADYVLFIGLCPVAVVEAKKSSKNVPGVLEQAKRYSRDFEVTGDETPAGPALEWTPDFKGWPSGVDDKMNRIPFVYASNGREYHRQLETQSGIWFADVRKPTNLSRAIFGWPSPEGLGALLEQDVDAANEKLAKEPTDYLGLRDYQLEAIECVEEAIRSGRREILLAMATGTGKTRTAIGLIYRLLKAKRFRRVLLLVDRSALGVQAQNAFKDMRLESNKTFTEIFEVKELGDIAPENSTRVHIATVQGMVRRCLWPTSDDELIPPDQYDAIVVDESHRGYTLDQDMTEGEMQVRGMLDYVSTYRRVLDYFDAVRIGLTATPALHTTQIFGPPVFRYSYKAAVLDGHLADHDPPVRILTKLSKGGIQFLAGQSVTIIESSGNTKLETLEDEVNFEVAEFNAKVVAPEFTRVVAEFLAKEIDPNGDGKTLVFACNDDHADRVVIALKKAFQKELGSLDDGAVRKITGATDKTLEVIRRYRNERLPNVAVTVDLLTTGIDVPKIVNLVFLRRVRSRILFEQMLGRATRLSKEIEKEKFTIYDAVGIYDGLQAVSDMKPAVKWPNIKMEQLCEEMLSDGAHNAPGRDTETTHADDVRNEIVARIRRLNQRADRVREKPQAWLDVLDALDVAVGKDVPGLADHLNDLTASQTRAFLTKATALPGILVQLLEVLKGHQRQVYLSDDEDELISDEAAISEAKKPKDYLEEFDAFLKENRNKVAGLNTVLTRPRDLTREQLKELKANLHQHGFSEPTLRRAWLKLKNEDLAASIIGWIRQRALGSPAIPYEHRVDNALQKVLRMQDWTLEQQEWLERIASQTKLEIIVDEQAFQRGAFQTYGGYAGIDKKFGGKLSQVLDAFGDAIWEDAA